MPQHPHHAYNIITTSYYCQHQWQNIRKFNCKFILHKPSVQQCFFQNFVSNLRLHYFRQYWAIKVQENQRRADRFFGLLRLKSAPGPWMCAQLDSVPGDIGQILSLDNWVHFKGFFNLHKPIQGKVSNLWIKVNMLSSNFSLGYSKNMLHVRLNTQCGVVLECTGCETARYDLKHC